MSTKKGDCCEDKQITIKTEKHTSVSQSLLGPAFELIRQQIFSFVVAFNEVNPSKEIYSMALGSPPTAIYKFCRVFLI